MVTFSAQAEVLKFDIVGYQRKLFSYKEVCQKMVSKHMLLVSVKNPAVLDCMGKEVKVSDFCQDKVEKKNFLRGYANTKLEEVTCEYGVKAFLSLGCDKAHKSFCEDPEKGCTSLKKVYAHSLELDHHAFLEKDIDNVLNCYYGHPEVKKAEIIGRPVREWEMDPIIDTDLFEFSKSQNEKAIPRKL